MTQTVTAAAQECIFCAIARHEAEASVVYEDETVVAFMDRYPVTPEHLPRSCPTVSRAFKDRDAAVDEWPCRA